MEEPELRVGGWEKEKGGRFFRRLFSLILVILLSYTLVGPALTNYNPAYVPNDSLYLANGMWNGPFDIQYSKEFAGHLKVSSVSYETTDGESGKLKIVSISSLVNLEQAELGSRVIEIVKEEAKKEGLGIENGNKLRDEGLDLPAEYSIYQWDGVVQTEIDETDLFFDEAIESERIITVKSFFWNEKDTVRQTDADLESKLGIGSVGQYQTVLCISFGINGKTIEQATSLCEDVF